MNRSDFKKLVQIRLGEVEVLLNKRKYSGAYYLCGYVIEYALKACFARKIRKFEFPDKEAVIAIYKHNPKDLMKASGLQPDLERELARNKKFEVYWATVNNWGSKARYEIYTDKEAHDLYEAINDQQNGVLRWIQNFW